jgi:hypothetical protein
MKEGRHACARTAKHRLLLPGLLAHCEKYWTLLPGETVSIAVERLDTLTNPVRAEEVQQPMVKGGFERAQLQPCQ